MTMRNIIPTILAFLLAAATATAQTQGISARATNGYMVAPMFLSNNVVLLKASNPYNQTSYANPGAARAAATSGDTIVVYPGTYSVTNLAKDGVNWHFYPGTILRHLFDELKPQQQAIFQDNDYVEFNQYGEGTNSMSFKVTGTVIATNLQSAFAAFSGVKTKVDFELPGSEITISNGATFVKMVPGCVVIQLPDLYTYPANKPAMDTRVNFTASKVSGLIYLSDAAATWDVDLYENCAWWLDRDTTNAIYPSSVFRGREARNCNIVAGGAQATGHANGQIAEFDIPLWYGGDPLALNTNIAHVNMGTIVFHGTRFYQGTNATDGLFWLSTGGTSASIDFTNAGWIIFNDCQVVGKAGNTMQLIGEDNGESHTNKGRIFIQGDLAYVNASIAGMPTNNGPGQIVEVYGLTNNSSGFTGVRKFQGSIAATFIGSGAGLTNVPSKFFTTIAAMTNYPGASNLVVYVDSYFGSNVWGGGKFRWDNTSETINGGTIFAANGGGRWKRFDTGYPTNFYFMEWFGVVPNAAIDQYAGAQACINATPSDLGSCILPPYGFAVGTSLTWTNRKGCYFGALNSMKTKSSGYRVFPYPVSTIHWMGVSGGTNLVCYDVGHNTFAGFGLDTRIGLNNGDQWTNAAGLLMDVDMYPTHSTTTIANVFDGIYFRERGTNTTLVGQRIASYNWQNCEFFRWYDCYWQGGGWNLPEYWVTTTNLGASKGIQLGGNGGGQNSFQHYMFNCGWDRWMYNIHSSGGNWVLDNPKSTAAGAAAFYLNGDHQSIIRFADCEGDRQFLISPGDTVTLIGNRIADAVQSGYTNLSPVDAVKLNAYGNYFQHEAYIPAITNSFTSTGSYDGAGNSFDTTNDALIASWKFNSAFNSRGDFGTLKDHNNIQSGPWKTPSSLMATNFEYAHITDSATFPVLTLMSSNGAVAVGGYINNVLFSVWNADSLNRVPWQVGDQYKTVRARLMPTSTGSRTQFELNSDYVTYSYLRSTNTEMALISGFNRNSINFVTNYGEITVGPSATQLATFGTSAGVTFPADTNFSVTGPAQFNSLGATQANVGQLRATNYISFFTNGFAGLPATPTRYGQIAIVNTNATLVAVAATTSGSLAWGSTNVIPTTSAQVVNKFTGTPTGSLFLRDDGTLAAPSVGGVAWGAISGTLSSQTDLQTALDAKAALAEANQFTKTNAFDAIRVTNLLQGASTAIVGWNAASKLLTTQSVSVAGSQITLGGTDGKLLYNNSGGIDYAEWANVQALTSNAIITNNHSAAVTFAGTITGNGSGITNLQFAPTAISLGGTNAAMLSNMVSTLIVSTNVLFTNWPAMAVAGYWGRTILTNSQPNNELIYVPTNMMPHNLTNSVGCYVVLDNTGTNWACTLTNLRTAELVWSAWGGNVNCMHAYFRHW